MKLLPVGKDAGFFAVADNFFRQSARNTGYVFEQRGACGIQIDADIVYYRTDNRIQLF